MTLDDLNALDQEEAEQALLRCCGSARWARTMAESRPFGTAGAAADAADTIWRSLDRGDWLEAFGAHPRIGAGGPDEAGRFGASGWAAQEQSGARHASNDERERLAEGNRRYEARFGYIFIVCATGKSAGEMVTLLEDRLQNEPDEDIGVAAEEQRKITRLRLAKLLGIERGP